MNEGSSIRVLLVDDDPERRSTTADALERTDDRLRVGTAASAAAGLDRLGDDPAGAAIDCVISAYELPERDGLAFLRAVRELDPTLPFVLFTASGSERVASEAISAGVTDYLRRDVDGQFAVLANRIATAVDRARSRRELAESRKRLSLFVDQSPIGVVEFDEAFSVVDCNPAAAEILGYDRESLVGSPWERLVPPAARDDVEDAVVDTLLDDRGGYHSVNENLRGDGTVITCEWHNRVVTDDDGDVVGIFSQFQDVTERVERERRLGLMDQFVREMDDGAVLVREGTIEYVNPRVTELVGYPEGELLGESMGRFIAPEHRGTVARRHRARVSDTAADPPPPIYEIELLCADGERLPVEINATRTTYEGDPATLSLVRDLTARRERRRRLESLHGATRELIQADDRQAAAGIAVETARDVLELPITGVYLYDGSADALRPAVVTAASDEVVGEPPVYGRGEGLCWDVFESGEARMFDDVSTEPGRYNPDTPISSELLLPLGAHGVLISGSTTAGAFDAEDSSLAQILAANLTAALDRVEQRQALASRNERLDEFASIVSHDLRNPLNVAGGRLALARTALEDLAGPETADADGGGDEAPVADILEHIETADDALDRMEALIEDLLALAVDGESALEYETVHVGQLARRCWSTLDTGDATLETASLPPVVADPGQLGQLLENLLSNAVSHGGPDVTVDLRGLADGGAVDGGVPAGAAPGDDTGAGGDLVGFVVEDDGTGLPDVDHETLFNAGFTTAEEGTGFGLTIVQQVADAHGWELDVGRSDVGGARFAIRGVEPADGPRA